MVVNMRNAWIEVKTKSSTCQKVAKALRSMPEVSEADALFGNVDVLCLVKINDEAKDYLDELELLIGKIKELDNVVTTVTRPTKRPVE